jgi:hypothetical protein
MRRYPCLSASRFSIPGIGMMHFGAHIRWMSIGSTDTFSDPCILLAGRRTRVIGSNCYLVGISYGKCIGCVMPRSELATTFSGYRGTAHTEASF